MLSLTHYCLGVAIMRRDFLEKNIKKRKNIKFLMEKRKFKKQFNSIKNKISEEIGWPIDHNINEIVKNRMKSGKKELKQVKKEAIKQFNPKIVDEFDKLAKKKSKKIDKTKTEISLGAKLQARKKIIEGIKKLARPFKITRNNKKEIEIFPEK